MPKFYCLVGASEKKLNCNDITSHYFKPPTVFFFPVQLEERGLSVYC